jgi:hypothetical protein
MWVGIPKGFTNFNISRCYTNMSLRLKRNVWHIEWINYSHYSNRWIVRKSESDRHITTWIYQSTTHDAHKKWNHTEFVGLEVFTAVVINSIIFWDMTPCSPLSVNQLSPSTLKMEAICFTKTSADTQRTTWRHIPDGDTVLYRICSESV